MAYYLIRGTYSAEGYRGMIDNPSDREIATRALNQQLGIETIAYFNSLSEAGFVGILKANPDQMATAQMVGMSSGAFTKVSAEELTPSIDVWRVFEDDSRVKKPVPKLSLMRQTAMKSTACCSTNDHDQDRHLERRV